MPVFTRGTDAIPLAARPHLGQYRKLAKDLLRAARDSRPEAIRDWADGWLTRLANLNPSAASHDAVDDIVRDVLQTRLVASRDNAGNSLGEAQMLLAQLHGFESWPKFARHIEARRRDDSAVSRFERAADAIADGELELLASLLRENRRLVRARSTRHHRATLLHYIAANGHEGFRQRTAPNVDVIARLLLESGAEVDARAMMYGHSVTTMQMLVSSSPPNEAAKQLALVEILLEFGAAPDGVENDGSPIMTALRFHYPQAAQALARGGARVDNVIFAAALGRVDLVDRLIADDGTLRTAPGASGPWPRLSKDPREHLGYALTWACALGQTDVVELMMRKGVAASGRDDDATALHFAAAFGRLDLVQLLLRHGASLEALNSYDGTVLDGVVWYALNAPHDGVDYAAVARALIDLGAR
ncbi:MAG: ankyrin repeat domain-containing protein, partial [Candidatus Hydrogenedentales bacterium]